MAMRAFDTIVARRDGAVLHLTLNRPEVRNAMSLAMVGELRDALQDAEADGTLRVVVLRGAGGHFCAGADLKDLAAARSADASAVADSNARFGELCVAFSRTPLALVAVLEGSVMGGGFGLACVADVAIAGDSATFRLPEVSLGVVPAQIAPFLVERLGYAEAKRLGVSAAKIDAREALALRLVHEVHAADALDAAVARTVATILHCAPGAISATKALLAKARFVAPQTLVHEAADVFARAALGPEGVEGTAAFLQKRKPRWAPQ
jgi:isohexenylglutaconyl-CoA hydratase